MSKHRISTFAVDTKDWMQFRPYEQFSPQYDSYYLKLSNRVFESINSSQHFLREFLLREELVELSVILSSWFEDYANEIGLWAAYTRKNKELHGFYLPFYALHDYDPEAINVEDLSYLIWHYSCKQAEKIISPDSPGLRTIGVELANIFENALDDAPGTDFYEKYLDIPDDIYYFKLKAKLHWLAFQNYLTAPEFKDALEDQIEKIRTERAGLMDQFSDLSKLVYAIQDDYLYKKSSSFLAFTMPEWLAEIAHCPESLRADIRGLFQRILGEFVFENKTEAAYQFRHAYTKRLFLVKPESVTMKGIATGATVYTSLIDWKGSWWVTGTLASVGDATSATRKNKDTLNPGLISFYAYSSEQQQILRETAADSEAAFLEFFGSRLVFFKNEKDLQAAMRAESDYYNETKTKGGKREKPNPKLLDKFAKQLELALKDVPLSKGLGVFYEPGVGTLISPVLSSLVYWLQKEEPTPKEVNSLFISLFSECSPVLRGYLLDQYGSKNLRFPVKTHFEILEHLDFLSRYYNPGGYREVLPNHMLILEE